MSKTYKYNFHTDELDIVYDDSIPVRYTKPDGFSWVDTFLGGVRRNSTTLLPEALNTTGGVFDVASLKSTPVATYFVGYTADGTPSDSNSGLTKALSFATMTKALSMSAGSTISIYVYAGTTFYRTGGGTAPEGTFPTGVGSRHVNIIGDGGTVTFSCHENKTWVLDSGACYKTTGAVSLTNSVWDALNLDANGDFTQLTLVASKALCISTAGTYYVDGSNIVYVHMSDDRNPGTNNDIRLFRGVYNGVTSPGYTLYLENCIFHGGVSAFNHNSTANDQDTRVYAKNCQFKYSGTYNAFNTLGLKYGILQNCLASCSVLDGFNYHKDDTYALPLPKVIEIDCTGRDNGWGGANTNNGSTIHDGGSIVRIHTEAYRNNGPNIADATTGSTIWMVGCVMYDSEGTGTSCANYYTDSSTAWLDSCLMCGSSIYGITILASDGVVYVRDLDGDVVPYLAASATLRPY